MNTKIFKKAKELYQKKQLVKTNETQNRVYYKVGKELDYDVFIEVNPETKTIKHSCTCIFGSLKRVHTPICSHVLAVLIQEAMREE